MARQGNLYHFWGILNCLLLAMAASGMCHLVIYFPKIYHCGEKGALITFVYIQIRHPSHSSPSVFVQHFWRLLWSGGEQNRPAPKDDLLDFFLGVDLVFFTGWRAFFTGWRAGRHIFFRKHHYPFDLQVGPLFGTRGELAPSRQILESTLYL